MSKAENIIIPNPDKLVKLKKAIIKAGIEKFYVVSDFDNTLTTAFVNGERTPSLMAILRNGNYLIPSYARKAQALFNKYHPIEVDPSFPLKEKKEVMHKWWITHFKLLIESGLNKEDIEDVVVSGENQFREGTLELIDNLSKHAIPLIILSANGLGRDAIKAFLEEENKLLGNVHIVSNSYEWNRRGYAVAIKEPIIHSMNKDLATIGTLPVLETIKTKANILLLGDNLGDTSMVENLKCSNLIKIGFLNDNVEDSLEKYKKSYDIVLLGDPSMDYVNQLINELVK